MQGDQCYIRLPITINLLRILKRELQQSHYSIAEQRMLWSAFMLAFCSFLHASEYLSLQWLDINYNNRITINLRQSKTDPFRKGHQIHVYPTNTSTFPVRVFLLNMPFSNSTTAANPVFIAGRFAPLTQASLNKALRSLLSRDQSQYTSHIFRIGATTTTAAARIPAWMIKSLGRWTSNASMSYIHCSP